MPYKITIVFFERMMTHMKFLPTLAIILISQSVEAAPSSDELKARVNAPLTTEQLQFLKNEAPYLVQPKCNLEGYDNLGTPWYDGDYDSSNNSSTASGRNNQTKLNNLMTNGTEVAADFREMKGGANAMYLFYRPWSNGSIVGHLHDTESATKVYKKKNPGSSLESDLAAQGLEWKTMISNKNADSVKVASHKDNVLYLGSNSSQVNAALDDLKDIIGSRDSLVAATLENEPSRPFIYSAPSGHELYPIFDLTVANKALNSPTTCLFVEENSLAAQNIENVWQFNKTKVIKYKIVELANEVADKNASEKDAKGNMKTKADMLLAGDRVEKCTAKDFYGNEICTIDIKRNLKDDDGSSGSANMNFDWSSSDATVVNPVDKNTGKAQGKPRISAIDLPKWNLKVWKDLFTEDDVIVVRDRYFEPTK